MKTLNLDRRTLLSAAALAGVTLIQNRFPLVAEARAQALEPTQTMRGGSNNYRPNAPVVERLGEGFLMSGLVRSARDGAPLEGVRIQIWAATTVGGEPDPRNHGSVLTGADGTYQLEMPQIIPYFGQPHAHLAYDDGKFQQVFLRPVMASAAETSMKVDFVLAPV